MSEGNLVFGCQRRRCWAAALVKEAIFLPGGTRFSEWEAVPWGFETGGANPDHNAAFTEDNFKSARGRRDCWSQAHEVLRGGRMAAGE